MYVAGPTVSAFIATSLSVCPPLIPDQCFSLKDSCFSSFSFPLPFSPGLDKDSLAASSKGSQDRSHQQRPWEHPGVGAIQELLVCHGNLSANCSRRLQLSEPSQSRTWKGYEFLKLLFQPADFFAKLNVIHPAKTQMKTAEEEKDWERKGSKPREQQPANALSARGGEHRFTCLLMGNGSPLRLLLELHGLYH